MLKDFPLFFSECKLELVSCVCPYAHPPASASPASNSQVSMREAREKVRNRERKLGLVGKTEKNEAIPTLFSTNGCWTEQKPFKFSS